MTNYTTLESPKKVKKETVFTHYVSSEMEIDKAGKSKPSDYKNVLHLWKDTVYGGVFKCWDDDENNATLYFGEKGEEFE